MLAFFTNFRYIAVLLLLGPWPAIAQRTVTTHHDNGQKREVYEVDSFNGREVKHGLYKIYHDNGELWQKGIFRRGKLDSTWIDNYYRGMRKQVLHYEEGLLQDTTLIYFRSGQLKQKVPYKDDKVHGEVRLYHENGNLKEISHYRNGAIHGEVRNFYKDGELRSVQEFRNGIPNGPYKAFHENGHIKEKGFKVGGEFDSTFTSYYKDYANGAKQKHCHYENGKLNGEFITYHPTGSIESVSTFKDGEREGEYRSFHKIHKDSSLVQKGMKGPLRSEGIFEQSEKVGTWKSYYANGELHTKGKYSDDNTFQGMWKVYYPNGNLKQVGKYVNGEAQGEWKFYYYTGELQNSGSYKNDKKTSLWKTYYRSGELMSEIEYRKGKRHGMAISYNEEGEVQQKIHYENGEVVEKKSP